jgi:hypothetical protein
MTQSTYRSPRLTSVIGGILLAVVLLISLCMLGSVVKTIGAAVFFLPARLGVLPEVRATDVAVLDMQHSPSVLAFARAGRYHVYTADLTLLETASLLDASSAKPWMVVRSASSGIEVPVTVVARGVRPYDSPSAPGRPILAFTLPSPGLYTLSHPSRQATMAIVPDQTTGKEGLFLVAAVVELALLCGAVVLIARRRRRRKGTLRSGAAQGRQQGQAGR